MCRLTDKIISLITGRPMYSDNILTTCPHCGKIISVKRFDDDGNLKWKEVKRR